MSWKECSIMDERMKFVSRLVDGEKMSELCREFNISRKTGYKFYNRYQQEGMAGFYDKSRKPLNSANRLVSRIENLIIEIKREFPTWGARKIRERVKRKHSEIILPALSTIHAVLSRHDLVKSKKKRYKSQGTELSKADRPNELWSADFKGQFKLKNGKYCYPLTITDNVSRFILACESLDSVAEQTAFPVFERVFKEYGLPNSIRTDNGVPFANARTIFNLSKLSVWWHRLGIKVERIEPGHPEQNGRHERMHRTLKEETTKPAANNFLQQQEKFDLFMHHFNSERPHEALDMKYPSEVHLSSQNAYFELEDLEYPKCDYTRKVGKCGIIQFFQKKVYISTVLGFQHVGVKKVDEEVWKVSFMDYDLGFFEEEHCKLELCDNPFL